MQCWARVFFGVSILFLFSFTATAQNYFVSTKGNNLNSGTASRPWRTIQKACNATKGCITFRNYKQEKVIISGTNKKGTNIIKSKNYIRGQDAMGITVYALGTGVIRNLIIDKN